MELLQKIDYYFNLTSAIITTVIGLIGNSIVLYIFTRKKFLEVPMFRYLIVNTIAATIEVLTIWPYNLPSLMAAHSISCKFFQYISYVAWQYGSWIITVCSIDRWMDVKFPSIHSKRRSVKFQIAVLTIMFIAFSIINVPYLVYFDVFDESINTTNYICEPVDSIAGFYINLGNLLLSTVLPFIVMLIFSILIARELIKKKIRLSVERHKLRKEIQLIKVMTGMNISFLLCYLPFCVFTVVSELLSIYSNNNQPYFMVFIFDLTNFLVFFYSAAGILIHFVCNKLFRQRFHEMFQRKRAIPHAKQIRPTLNSNIKCIENKQDRNTVSTLQEIYTHL